MPEDQERSNASDHDPTGAPPAPPARGTAAPGTGSPPAAGATGATTSPPPWELVVMIAGAAVLIGSFLAFVSIADGEAEFSWNAWSNALSLFPVSVLVVLYAVIAAGQLALARFTGSTLADRVAGFTWPDLRLLFGTLATLTMIGYFARGWSELDMDRGIGMYIMTLGAIGLLAGAVMEHRQSGRSASPRRDVAARQPTQGDIAIMIAGGAILLGSFLTVLTPDEGETASAWAAGLFPLYVVPAALGAAMAAQVALTTFGTARIPDRILGLEWSKVHLAFGLHAALMMLGFLIGTFGITVQGVSSPEPDNGVGFWIMLLAALGLAAGAILRDREPAAGQRSGAPAPTGPAAAAPPPSAGERLESPGSAPPRPSERLEGPESVPPRASERLQAFCPHCGTEMRPADRFCAACGKERADHA